ncbi:YjbF family lipoprotein [Idiomarina seosinensis]|uniref:YjbF family lipoprotein n=1 Tax=Idiomarina seosinensis TaxID=281739 RepID=A0A432ZI43_9GAMM|nr:YjbF family lipoprotein [Idiomarina seosinensis]RUO76942.1 hypothetical protein CWI81_00075 [Idiomarina seosinensis]
MQLPRIAKELSKTKLSKTILLLSTAVAVSGCGSRVYSMIDTVDYTLFGQPDVALTSEQIKQLPYAAQYAQFGEQPRAVVMLAFIDNQLANRGPQYQWAAGEDDILLTENGRMVGTRNLAGELNVIKQDLVNLRSEQGDPLYCLTSKPQDTDGCAKSWQATAEVTTDFGRQRYGIKSQITDLQQQSIQLPNGDTVNSLKVTESVTSNGLSANGKPSQWQYNNAYWIAIDSAAGEVLKTEQQLVPGLPRLKTVSLKRIKGSQ